MQGRAIANNHTTAQIQYIGGPLYAIGTLGFKLSLLLAYLRFAGFQRRYRIILWTVIILATLNSIIFTFVFDFICTPSAETWNRALPGKCLGELSFYFAIAGASIGFDILVIGLPFPTLKQLKVDLRKRIGLSFLYGLGVFVTAVQIMPVQTIASLKVYTESQKPVMWSTIEIHVGVIISCILTYTPLLWLVRSKIVTSPGSWGKSVAYKDASEENKASNGPSLKFRSGGKSRVTIVRISTMMEDEITLCDAPNRGFRTWIERKETVHGVVEYEDVAYNPRASDFDEISGLGYIRVMMEVQVSDGHSTVSVARESALDLG